MAARWDEAVHIGVESVDAEHRLQVSLIHALEELARRGETALAERTMRQLVDFTHVHFLSEELMMRLYSYPQHDAHKAEHARLAGELGELQQLVTAGDPAIALAAIESLQRWLLGHIRTQDLSFASWSSRNGIRVR